MEKTAVWYYGEGADKIGPGHWLTGQCTTTTTPVISPGPGPGGLVRALYVPCPISLSTCQPAHSAPAQLAQQPSPACSS